LPVRQHQPEPFPLPLQIAELPADGCQHCASNLQPDWPIASTQTFGVPPTVSVIWLQQSLLAPLMSAMDPLKVQ
jgi:hypothetical protein